MTDSKVCERVRTYGVKSASPVDLFAVAFSRRAEDADLAQSTARDVLKTMGSIGRVADASFEDIKVSTGLEEFEALRCLALIELGRRAGQAEKGLREEIEVPEDVFQKLEWLRTEKKEHFIALLLNTKNEIISTQTVHIGTVNMSVVGLREVFRPAIREGASSIIVAHNHPSGDPTPSPEDFEVTKRLVEVGRLLDIPVLDHVIVGDPIVISFSRRGWI